MRRPLIGITVDNVDRSATSGFYRCGTGYPAAVAAAGGVPVLLPHEPALAADYARLCDGLLLTGGADPQMEDFGCRTDARARLMDRRRQDFELALLAAVDALRADSLGGTLDKPLLGVCLGMQLMTLHHGGTLDQFLPDRLGAAAEAHQDDRLHPLQVREGAERLLGVPCGRSSAEVASSHRQAVQEPGRLALLATAPDGVVEAVGDPSRPFYLGVQWHPERTQPGTDHPLGWALIRRLVEAARGGA